MGKKCSTCGKTYKTKRAFGGHKIRCRSPKNPEQNATRQEEASSSVRDRKYLLNFHIERRPRSSRGAAKEMEAAEGLRLLQYPRGKDTSSDNEPEIDYSGVESAADNSDAIDNSDAVQEDNPMQRLYGVLILDALRDIVSDRNSASVDLCGGTESCGNEALWVEEMELIHNDDGQRLVDCPENSAAMEPRWPKLDLKVSDSSDNPACDDAEGGNNGASGSGMSLTEPMATEADREQEQKLDVLETPLPLDTTSVVDQSGTDSPGDESLSAADTSDEVQGSMEQLQLVAQGLLDLRNSTD